MNCGGTEFRVFAKDKASLVSIIEKSERYFEEGIAELRGDPYSEGIYGFYGWSSITEKHGSSYLGNMEWVKNDRVLYMASFIVFERLNALHLWEDPVCQALDEHPEVLLLTASIDTDNMVDPSGQLLEMYEALVLKHRSGEFQDFYEWMCGEQA